MAATVACSGAPGTEGAQPGETPGAAMNARQLYQCPAAPKNVEPGDFVGDQLPDLTVKDCEGNDVNLAQFCQADAMWLYVVHTWCPHCRNTGKFAEKLHDEYAAAGKKLVSVQIVLQNDDHQPATRDDCKAWKQLNGLADNITLYDSTGVTRRLNDSTKTSLSLFLDRNQVIRGKSHADQEDLIRKGIDKAFSAK